MVAGLPVPMVTSHWVAGDVGQQAAPLIGNAKGKPS